MRLSQVDMSTTRKYGGTGLGLSIVKTLVEAHDSTVELSSKLGQGTSFSFSLEVRGPGQGQRVWMDDGRRHGAAAANSRSAAWWAKEPAPAFTQETGEVWARWRGKENVVEGPVDDTCRWNQQNRSAARWAGKAAAALHFAS